MFILFIVMLFFNNIIKLTKLIEPNQVNRSYIFLTSLKTLTSFEPLVFTLEII
jgi:hypothetical protein